MPTSCSTNATLVSSYHECVIYPDSNPIGCAQVALNLSFSCVDAALVGAYIILALASLFAVTWVCQLVWRSKF